jgi:hypothetical protein
MVLDTETANGYTDESRKLNLMDSLVYDIGFVITDKKGRIYETRSLTIKDVFCDMPDLMRSSYYADKIPSYWQEIKEGKRELVSFWTARKIVRDAIERYNITSISAHNASFDVRSLNNTIRYLTQSFYRYFFPYGVEIWDTYKAAIHTVCKQKGYIAYCKRNNYLTKHKKPRVRATAEILYRFISNNNDFSEEHKGLDDCIIETKILHWILRQHSKKEYLVLYA